MRSKTPVSEFANTCNTKHKHDQLKNPRTLSLSDAWSRISRCFFSEKSIKADLKRFGASGAFLYLVTLPFLRGMVVVSSLFSFWWCLCVYYLRDERERQINAMPSGPTSWSLLRTTFCRHLRCRLHFHAHPWFEKSSVKTCGIKPWSPILLFNKKDPACRTSWQWSYTQTLYSTVTTGNSPEL